MRWPIFLARKLGDLTAEYRWFAGLYLVSSFFLLPAFIFALSMAGLVPLYSVLGAVALFFASVGLINIIQTFRPEWLPGFLQTWEFLPLWMRSLKPLDDFFGMIPCCRKCTNANESEDPLPDVEMALRADYSLIPQNDAPNGVSRHAHSGMHVSISKTPLIRDPSFACSIVSNDSIDFDEKSEYPM
jgi:hypothetical protein